MGKRLWTEEEIKNQFKIRDRNNRLSNITLIIDWIKSNSYNYRSLLNMAKSLNISIHVLYGLVHRYNLKLTFNKDLPDTFFVGRKMKYNVGDKLGKLTLIKKIPSNIKRKPTKFLVKCDCGNEFLVLPYTLNTRKCFSCKECMIKDNLNTGKWLSKGRRDNEYKIQDNIVIINNKIKIDKDDLDKVKSYNRYWSINSSGYAYCCYNNQQVFLHRIILNLPIRYDKNTNEIADHINKDRLDNRKTNLRILNKNKNSINCGLYQNNTSGCKGVYWVDKLHKWEAGIYFNNKNIYLGVYDNKEDAIKIRKEAEQKYFKNILL